MTKWKMFSCFAFGPLELHRTDATAHTHERETLGILNLNIFFNEFFGA